MLRLVCFVLFLSIFAIQATIPSSPKIIGTSIEDPFRDESDEESEVIHYDSDVVSWIDAQVTVYRTKLAVLSVELEKKGFPVRGIIPQKPGLVCAKSSEEFKLRCRVYMEPEVGSKVVAPCHCKGTQKWIAIRALNQQRRKDPQKWQKCPICLNPIDYSIYEGYLVGIDRIPTSVLNSRATARLFISAALAVNLFLSSVLFQSVWIRLVASKVVWDNWHRIKGLAGGGLTLYILLFQWARKKVGGLFARFEDMIRDELTEIESSILERTVPETMTAQEAEESM